MKNKTKSDKFSIIFIIVLILFIICAIVLMILWIPNLQLPSKTVRISKDEITYSDDIATVEDSFNSKNLWNYYYGKTASDVIKVAPEFMEIGENMYLLDSGFVNGDENLPTNLVGIFENGKLEMLSLFYHISDGSICGIQCRDDPSCIDGKALEYVAALSAIYIDHLGLLDEDHDYDYSENYEYFIDSLNSGINCVAPLCPGVMPSLICGIKDGDELYEQTVIMEINLGY